MMSFQGCIFSVLPKFRIYVCTYMVNKLLYGISEIVLAKGILKLHDTIRYSMLGGKVYIQCTPEAASIENRGYEIYEMAGKSYVAFTLAGRLRG